MWTKNFQMYKLDLEKAEEPEIKMPTSITKECSNYHTIALFSHASKVMIKILQARLQRYVNREIPDVQAGF